MQIREIQAFVFSKPGVAYITWPETFVQHVLHGHGFRQELLAEMGVADEIVAYRMLSERHPSRVVTLSFQEAFDDYRTFVWQEMGIQFMPGQVHSNHHAAIAFAQKAGLGETFLMMYEDFFGIGEA